ncbi:vWA domain-containing protein [Lacinutrix jangbogonensis]|uniref:VWA domain-containing protein n=1 Tax=Lacinutrix jangbogonensis TaxID=1469557 RepID=UPI00053DDBFB|nr:VWA domain-containing protein [Lacinutrix jangbogonensis]
MSTQTLLLIILAGIVALLLALFQYKYKSKGASKKNSVFALLRFLSIFGMLLLLINPKFEQINVYNEKPNLVIAIDNSNSIKYLNQEENVTKIVQRISSNETLRNKFNIDVFSFGNTLNTSDSLSFTENQTNIDKAFKELNQVYKRTVSPTIIISDGNQTYGNDYEYTAKKYNQPIYSIVVGDTARYLDLQLKQLNVNKYAFLKNKFPVEVILVYNGAENVNTKFVVTSGKNTVYSKNLSFSETDNSKFLNFTLPANSVGVKSYSASIIPIATEKNKANNSKNFAVEVVDEKTKVAIVSAVLHPDLGMLKKSIETNEQRKVIFLNPQDAIEQLNDLQLVIVYNPNNTFRRLFEALKLQNKNKLVIAGPKTDFNFLNTVSENYQHDITSQTEDYQPILNVNYSSFIIDDLDFDSFPPLLANFGAPTFSVPFESILYKKVGAINTEEPLLATFEINGRREAVLFGENLWKWRAQSFINTKSFNAFDNFTGKLIQYLASNKRKNRLNLDYESFYQGSSNIVISAQFFNKNYEFDVNESLKIIVTDKISKTSKTIPFILKNNNYQVDLSTLPASEYAFTVKAANENISKSGNFKILEYNIEQQFLNANVSKLKAIADQSNGANYFVSNYNTLINELAEDNRYKPIQKSNKNIVPLIDWKYLLALIALTLAIEWFMRKYNGLI